MANLTPEQLALFRQYAPALLTGGSSSSMNYTDPSTGLTWAPAYSNGGIDGQGNPTESVLTGYYGGAHDAAGENSKNIYTGYDLNGNANSQFRGNDFSSEFDQQDMMGVIAVLASLYGGAALAGAGAGAGTAAGTGAEFGMGTGAATGSDLSAFYGGLDAGATLGGGASIGGGASLGAGATLGGGAATMGAGGIPYTTAAADSQLASSTLGLPMAGGGSAPAIAVNGGSSLLSGITSSGLLGPAATLIGGALGSQPQSSERTTQNQIDPRLVPYLYGDNGLMPQVQQQLARSTSPERQAGWDAMRNTGLGFMNQPAAGNGFSRFFPTR